VRILRRRRTEKNWRNEFRFKRRKRIRDAIGILRMISERT
jgi:hypothetical protein